MKAIHFQNLEQAFSVCREKNEPMMVIIEGHDTQGRKDGRLYKIYPSGTATQLYAVEWRESVSA